MSILAWLGLDRDKRPRHESAVVQRIVERLDTLDPRSARYLALFAFLLARVANVDLDVSEEEAREMERIIGTMAKLPPGLAALVVEIARAENELFGSTRNFLAAREFRDLATDDEKHALLHCLFAVSAADESISLAEEESIREIARELLLSNEEYIAIRSSYRDKRAVLRAS